MNASVASCTLNPTCLHCITAAIWSATLSTAIDSMSFIGVSSRAIGLSFRLRAPVGTLVRPSNGPSTRPSWMSTSHGDLSCADPSCLSAPWLKRTRLQETETATQSQTRAHRSSEASGKQPHLALWSVEQCHFSARVPPHFCRETSHPHHRPPVKRIDSLEVLSGNLSDVNSGS